MPIPDYELYAPLTYELPAFLFSIIPHEWLRPSDVTKSIGRWLLEAMELRKLGMPHDSFLLILDGSPLPEKTTQMFGIVQHHVGSQALMDMLHDRGTLPDLHPSWVARRFRAGYMWEDYPQAIANLRAGEYSSLIRCNFDLGDAFDPEVELERNPQYARWSAQDWFNWWDEQVGMRIDTEPPLPPFATLRPLSESPSCVFLSELIQRI